MIEHLQMRVHGPDSAPALIYLPGLHGDWTLIPGFRAALGERIRFVEVTYPRTLTWRIQDYAEQIELELLRNRIFNGWLLGESFGSQVAWGIVGRGLNLEDNARSGSVVKNFSADGVVLAGGFVKHPWKWGPGALRTLGRLTPMAAKNLILNTYKVYAKFCHRDSGPTAMSVDEFIARRNEADLLAIRHRLNLLDEFDPRPVAKHTRIPVHYLAGLIDPLVPYPMVRAWLRKNCPGYRGGKTLWRADHNVLATAPAAAAAAVIEWITKDGKINRPELISKN